MKRLELILFLLYIFFTIGTSDYMTEEFFLSKVFSESMQPSHVIPYYFRAVKTPKEEDITITTLITENRFHVFDRLVTNYQGNFLSFLKRFNLYIIQNAYELFSQVQSL